MSCDADQPWYHGSPLVLGVLRVGSTITQWRDLARVFSHKPPIVCISDSGDIQHNGVKPGYLYEISEPIGPDDVYLHPRTTMAPGDEWLTTRELRLRLIAETAVCRDEFLSPQDIEALKRRADAQSGSADPGNVSLQDGGYPSQML